MAMAVLRMSYFGMLMVLVPLGLVIPGVLLLVFGATHKRPGLWIAGIIVGGLGVVVTGLAIAMTVLRCIL